MILSCCIWALSGPEQDTLAHLAAAGFTRIDVRPFSLTSAAAQAGARALDLHVSCVAASHQMPDEAALGSTDADSASRALEHIEEALAHSAAIGATTAYVVPEKDGSQEALCRWARALTRAAERAAALGLKLCVEHFPGGALPTVAATLDFLRDIDHPALYLLFDIGHAQMSGEDPAAAISQAGPRLGYVHLDDNDGCNDQHLALLDGVMTEESLQRTFAALEDIDYGGAVSLELSPELPDPLAALKESREIVRTVVGIA